MLTWIYFWCSNDMCMFFSIPRCILVLNFTFKKKKRLCRHFGARTLIDLSGIFFTFGIEFTYKKGMVYWQIFECPQSTDMVYWVGFKCSGWVTYKKGQVVYALIN